MVLLNVVNPKGNGAFVAGRGYLIPFLIISLLVVSIPLYSDVAYGANEAPFADAGEDIADVLLNEVHMLDGSNSTDEDLGNCTWLWECTSHTDVDITNSDQPIASFTVFTEEQITFQLTITDSEDEFDTDEILVTPKINEDPSMDTGSILPMDTGAEGPFYEISIPIEFNATSVTDFESTRDQLTFTWSSDVSGEGSFPSTAAFTRTMINLGWHNITLTVDDPNGGSAQIVKLIKVREDQAAPIAKMAVFPIRSIYDKGEVLTLDATRTEDINSFDDMETMNFSWTSNITGMEMIGYGAVLDFVPVEGYSNITLTVTDTDGLTSTAYQHIQVINQAPTAEITTPEMAYRGTMRTVNVSQLGSFSGFRSIDPNNDELQFVWDFGDGESAEGMNVTHSWAQFGTYNVTLDISDGSMKDSTASTQIQVSVNTIPEAVIEPVAAINVGDSYKFSANGSSDEDDDALTYKWDLDGDGTFDQSGFNTTYTYSEEGEIEITLRVDDGFAWAESKLFINPVFPNEAPLPKLVGYEDYVEGETITVLLEDDYGEITLDASASVDPDDDTNGNGVIDERERNNLTYYWDENAGSDSSTDKDTIKDNDFTKRSKTLRVSLENDNTFRVRLNVTDIRGMSTYLTIALKGNHAPVISEAKTAKGLDLYVNTTVLLQTTASDPDSKTAPLDYTWTIGETVLDGSQPTYSYTFREKGEFLVVAEVSDGTFSSSYPFTVNVKEFDGLTIKSPRENQILTGVTKLSGEVQFKTNFKIDSVYIKVDDGEWLDAKDDSSWEYELATNQYMDGPHTIYVKVVFKSGAEQVDSIDVQFKNKVETDNSGMIATIVIILVVAVIIGVVGYFLFGRKSNRTRDLMMDLPPPPGYGPRSPRMAPPGGLPAPAKQQNLPGPQPPDGKKEEAVKPPVDEGPKMVRIKCPACKKVFKVEDTGDRPLEMICTHCGAKGTISSVPGDEEEEKQEELGETVEEKPEPISIICPNCSGMFDLEEVTDVAKCPYCQASGDLDEDTITKLHERFDEKEPEDVTVKCPSCQGKFSIKSTDKDLICPFCGASGNVSGKN